MLGELVTLDFHGDTLFAIRDGLRVAVAVPPICDRLGLNWSSQLKRIKRDKILSEGMAKMTIPSPGGPQETVVLALGLIPGWLFGISENQVRPEARDAVLVYKRDCFDALRHRFFGDPVEAEARLGDIDPGRIFPDWPLEELRTKGSVVDRYRLTYGVSAARWVMPQLGFPAPPPDLIDPLPARQYAFDYPAGPPSGPQ